jgi:hypothetical protein
MAYSLILGVVITIATIIGFTTDKEQSQFYAIGLIFGAMIAMCISGISQTFQ